MSFRRFSFSSADPLDLEIDDSIKKLYDAETLDKRCDISLKENRFVQALNASGALDRNVLAYHYDKEPESVLDSLPKSYFTKEYDPVVDNLQEISTWAESDITENFIQKIEDTDSDKDVIAGQLTMMIDTNYDSLMACMTKVQEIDLHLIQAGLQINYGRKKIQSSQSILQHGPMKVLENTNKRDRLVNILDTIRSLKALKDVHKAMTAKINTGEVGIAAELALNVLQSLREQSFDFFIALKNISSNMQRSIYTIRRKSDKSLKRICGRKFTALEYESVMKSYLLLDHIEYLFQMKLVDVDYIDHDVFYYDSQGCIDGLAQRINRYQLEDIDVCFHAAIMEFITRDQQKKQKVAAEVNQHNAYHHQQQSRYSIGGNFNEIVDVGEVPLHILLRRLPAELLPLCIIKCCELLADIVHTHFLINQWHVSPFDERNHVMAHLHRLSTDHPPHHHRGPPHRNNGTAAESGDDDNETNGGSISQQGGGNDDEEEEVEVIINDSVAATSKLLSTAMGSGGGGSGGSGNNNTNGFSTLFLLSAGNTNNPNHKLVESRLQTASTNILQSRGILWEEVLRGLVNLLRLGSFTSDVKLDDFMNMTCALKLMIALGKEFCGMESRLLVQVIKEKSDEFFRSYHLETLQVLRMMAENEMWQQIPITIKSHEILTIIRTTHASYFQEEQEKRHHLMRRRSSSRLIQQQQQSSSATSNIVVVEDDISVRDSGGDHTTVNDEQPQPQHESILRGYGDGFDPFKFILKDRIQSYNFSSYEDDEDDLLLDEAADNRDSMESGNGMIREETSSKTVTDGEEEGSHSSSVSNTQKAVTNKIIPRYLLEAAGVWSASSSSSSVSGSSEVSFDSPSKKSTKNDDQTPYVVTQLTFNGLAKSFAKYIHMMSLIPSAAVDIFDYLTQLFDYYLCVTFYGFIPQDERLKFLSNSSKMTSPPPDHSRDFEILKVYLEKAFGDTFYIPKRDEDGNKSQLHNGYSSSATLVDSSDHSNTSTSSPLSLSGHGPMGSGYPSSSYDTVKVINLLKIPVIVSTADVSTCYALKERITAAESCWFVSQMLVEAKPLLVKLLSTDDPFKAEHFIDNYLLAMSQMRSLLFKVVGPMLISSNSILLLISECSWDAKRLREDHHEWVDILIRTCKQIWDFMMLSDHFIESSSLVREQIWLEVCMAAFDVTLEGYSKVRKCSAEGRASMIMDVFALHEGLNNIHLCRPPRGKHYVDNYLQAFCLSEEDIMRWINDNWSAYAYRHLFGMLNQTMSSMLNPKKLRDAVSVIDALYEVETNTSNSAATNPAYKFTSMISQRFKEDNKLGSMMNSKFKK